MHWLNKCLCSWDINTVPPKGLAGERTVTVSTQSEEELPGAQLHHLFLSRSRVSSLLGVFSFFFSFFSSFILYDLDSKKMKKKKEMQRLEEWRER